LGAFYDKFLKKRYKDVTSLQAVAVIKCPVLKTCVDYVQQGGASVDEACILDGPQGWSADVTMAATIANQTGRGASHYETWVSTYGSYFGKVKVSAKAVAGSKGREDAFLRQLTEVMDTNIASFGHIAGRKLMGPSGGYLGSATGNSAGTGTAGDPGFSASAGTIVLDSPPDAIHFAPGMKLQYSATTKGGTTLNSGGTNTVASVDVSNGIIYLSETVGDTTYDAAEALADNPATVYIFRAGDYITGTDTSVIVTGLGDWNPLTAIVGTTDNFHNVNRGQHEHLSGHRLTAAESNGRTIKERIELLVNKMRNAGSMDTDYVAVQGDPWMELSQDIQQYGWLDFGKVLEIGAGEIAIMTPNGVVKVMNEPHMPRTDIRVLTSKSMKMYNYNGFPGMPDEDGLKLLRDGADYSVQYEAYTCFTVNGRPHDFGIANSGLT
jgi:hypothetical protein